jgi:hypothetical protein
MKGVMGFLERAGLVRIDADQDVATHASNFEPLPSEQTSATPQPLPQAVAPAMATLQDIYASAGVPEALYPAERLLRLIDGLSAMDQGTRLMAIRAMDSADDSWTIADPLDDAQRKAHALALHAQRLQEDVRALEHDTLRKTESIALERDRIAGDIRQQIAELEALMGREMTRAAEDISAQEAQLLAVRQDTARQLESLSAHQVLLQNLCSQFGSTLSPKESTHG